MGKLILKTVKQPLVTEKVDTGLSVRQGNKHLRSGMNIRCLSSKFFFFFFKNKNKCSQLELLFAYWCHAQSGSFVSKSRERT